MKYSELKKQIYNYYKIFDKIDIDNIQDVNDHITSEDLNKSYFENTTYEFYITVAMCIYMIENDLYDNYFFEIFEELLDEYNALKNIINDEENELKNDIEIVKDYLKKEKTKEEYYENLSEIYDRDMSIEDE